MPARMRNPVRWLLAALVFTLFALLSGRAVRDRRLKPADDSIRPSHVLLADSVLSVESAVERDGRWYVADPRGHRVHVLDSTGAVRRSIGRRGRGPGEFIAPAKIARSSAHTYVAERTRPEISVFDSSGNFVRFLRARGPCADGNVAAMETTGSTLYVLRRCVELPNRIRLQVERSADGSTLTVWKVVADTTRIERGSAGLPIHVPVMAVNDTRLVMGDGAAACLRVVRLPDGTAEGVRCLHELPRQPVPFEERQKLNARWAGRVAVPDSMPRVLAIALRDSTIAVQIPETLESTTWIAVPWRIRPLEPVRALGRAAVQNSFLGPHSQLIVYDDADGIRLQVVPFARR